MSTAKLSNKALHPAAAGAILSDRG